MGWFYHLKIGKKLLCAFSLVIAFTCVMGLFSIAELVKVSKSSTDIATNWLPAVRYVGQVQTSLARYRISEASHILVDEGEEMSAIEKSMAGRLDTMRKQQESLAALVSDAEESRIYADLKQDIDAYLAQSAKLAALSRAGNKEEARLLFRGASNKLYRKLNEQFEALSKYNDEGSSGSEKAAAQRFDMSRKLIIGMLAALVVVGVLLALWVARIVAAPLNEAVAVAQRVAGGDLSASIKVESRDETGALMQSLRFEKLALGFEHAAIPLELLLDRLDRLLRTIARRHEVRLRINRDLVDAANHLAGERVEPRKLVDFVAEQTDPKSVLLVRWNHLHDVAAHAEGAASELDVVSLILDLHQLSKDLITIDALPQLQREQHPVIRLRRAKAIDARNAGDDDDVLAR